MEDVYNKLMGKRYWQLLHPIRNNIQNNWSNSRAGTSTGWEAALEELLSNKTKKHSHQDSSYVTSIDRGGESHRIASLPTISLESAKNILFKHVF